jgi:hypothetical protein
MIMGWASKIWNLIRSEQMHTQAKQYASNDVLCIVRLVLCNVYCTFVCYISFAISCRLIFFQTP